MIGDDVVGILLGTSELFYHGRTFEISDLCVAPQYQHHGVAGKLLIQ